jgi:hypothetical protein
MTITRSTIEQAAFDLHIEGNQIINSHGDTAKAIRCYQKAADAFEEASDYAHENGDWAAVERCSTMAAQAHENVGRAKRNDW